MYCKTSLKGFGLAPTSLLRRRRNRVFAFGPYNIELLSFK